MFNIFRKLVIAAISLTVAATSLHASAQQRIVGGSFAPNGAYPWAATLIESGGRIKCGASLIARKWVVTAAHCTPNVASVRVGTIDRESGGQVIRVIRIIQHPSHRGEDHDIALLELATPVSGITPIARATATPAVGSRVRLLGWGKITPGFDDGGGISRYLKMLDTTVWARSNCPFAGPGDLCIAGSRTATACKGDSGGPALSNGRLIGVTSRAGRTTDTCGVGTIYTNVPYYANWINSHVN